jgi:hypothetical protein
MASEFGQLCEPSEVGTRDAGHVAFVVITATETMCPGTTVKFNDFFMNSVTIAYGRYYQGLVDPFLANEVKPGQACRILLRPGMTRNLRHSFDIVMQDEIVSSQETTYEPVEDDEDPYYPGCRGCI